MSSSVRLSADDEHTAPVPTLPIADRYVGTDETTKRPRSTRYAAPRTGNVVYLLGGGRLNTCAGRSYSDVVSEEKDGTSMSSASTRNAKTSVVSSISLLVGVPPPWPVFVSTRSRIGASPACARCIAAANL